MASIKGKLFEFFVYRLLVSCGFKPVTPDGLLVFSGSPGLMVQGAGAPHNTDVLLSPPIQTPFYYPTRLIVECKCYNGSIGLTIIRNALGLRDDINNFEIVTDTILRNRKNNRNTGPKYYDMKRYVYQVAVASIDGFKSTVYPFAQAHRIPLISFSQSPIFSGIRRAISELDNIANASINNNLVQQINTYLTNKIQHPEQHTSLGDLNFDEFNAYINEIADIERRLTVGLLEDGTILFLLQADHEDNSLVNNFSHNDGCTIHWSNEDPATWILRNQGTTYYFELPKPIYDSWEQSIGKQRKDALKIKRNFFSKIVLFRRTDGNSENISIIRLSEQFMENAEESLHTQSMDE